MLSNNPLNPPGVGGSIFFRSEPVPYLSEYVCQIWLQSDGRVAKKGGYRQTDRQSEKGTQQLYYIPSSYYIIVDEDLQ